MKKVKKTKKVTAVKTKKAAAKVTPKKKVTVSPERSQRVAKKINKKSTAKKRTASRLGRKRLVVDKPLGLFVVVCGILGLVVFAVLGLNSMIASNQKTDEPVLGWFDNGAVAKPTGLKTTSKDGYVTITWNSVSGATGYKIWRKTGFFGSVSSIYTHNATYGNYTDKTAIPGKTYYYAVSAFKKTVQGRKTSFVKQVVSNLMAPSIAINNYNNSAYSVDLEVTIKAGSQFDGFYLYCASCEKTRIDLTVKGSPDNYRYYDIINGGVNVVNGDQYRDYAIKKLVASKKYTFQLSKYRILEGKRYESAKSTAVSFTMPATSSVPEAPVSFGGGSMSEGGGVSFYFKTPSIIPDGYQLNIACASSTATPIMYDQQFNKNYLISDTVAQSDGFSKIETGNGFNGGRGMCMSQLYAYFGSINIRLFPSTAATHFFNGNLQ